MTTGFQIKKATRQGVKPLIDLYSESGCGKTYSALMLARGLVGPTGKIAMIDTESGRGSLYADVLPGGYDVLDLTTPFSPLRYIEAIQTVEQSGAQVLIIDSMSHEWEGLGGVLDMAGEKEASSGKPGLHCWKEPKLQHARMMLKLLQSPLPIICCVRAKFKSRQKKDDRGKTQIVKDDYTTPIQSDDFIFEATAHAEILHNHTIRLTKCSHPSLRECFPQDEKEPIGIKHGEAIARWCANPGGSPVSPAVPKAGGSGSPPAAAGPSKQGTTQQRDRMFNSFREAGLDEGLLKAFAGDKGWLAPDDPVGDWPLNRVPTTMREMTALIDEINQWKAEGVMR